MSGMKLSRRSFLKTLVTVTASAMIPETISQIVGKVPVTPKFGTNTLGTSPLDRVNIRRLLMEVEKIVARYRYEFNDDMTRTSIVNHTNDFLENCRSRNAFRDYKIICDETNNSPKIIDKSRLHYDLFIQENRSIDFISVNMVLSP